MNEPIPVPTHFHVGIYARLSVDGCERKNESIDMQISIIKHYLKEHPEMELFGCYTDLGSTGTNFKRKGFERMMQDIRDNRINCVIVKDLSRFGRNHIETGNYIQKIFPFMGVRFIALTDGVDTFNRNFGTDEFTINLKNLVNEMYARDISQKIRSSRRSSRQRGSYTGGIPPYGYRAEWTDGIKRLCICPHTSNIVKDIYSMFLSGNDLKHIIQKLYKRGIHRPGVYRKTGHVYRQDGELLEQWSCSTVKLILTNPAYMGCLVQGTTNKSAHNILGFYDTTREDFTIRHNTHDPIISEEMFFRASSLFEKSRAGSRSTNHCSSETALADNIYADVLFCGNCGRLMARTASTKRLASGEIIHNFGYYCPASRRIDDLHCPSKGISMNTINKLVKAALHREFAISDLHPDCLTSECQNRARPLEKQLRCEMVHFEKRLASAKKFGSELYVKYHTGSLSLEEFQTQKAKNNKALHKVSEQKTALQYRIDQMTQELLKTETFLQTLIKCNENTALTKDTIHTLISRIDIYNDKRVKITFSFHMNDFLKRDGDVLCAKM